MKTNLFRLGAISAALAPGLAQAIGFGEIVLQSQIGEPLRAEIPLLTGPGEAVENACFSLAPVRGSDLPVVTAGRAQLIRSGQSYKLLVTGSKPISEPIFMIGVKAGCGVDLERDYVLMPQAPLMPVAAPSATAASTPAPAAAATRRSANYREVSARSGQTLEQIAEAQSPGSLVGQRRTLSAIKRLNPDIPAEQPLSEGTPVRVPDQSQRIAAESELAAAPPAVERPAPAPRVTSKPPKSSPEPRPKAPPVKAPPPPPKPAAPPAKARSDRLVLGAAPEDVRPPGRSASPSEVEERIQKLENTLQQLNQELDKMNRVLALTTQALTAQQQLQQRQAPVQSAPAGIAADPPAAGSDGSNWLELLLSALLGSGIAVGIAQYLGRRRPPPAEAELPLSMNVHRHETLPPVAQELPPSPAAAIPAEPPEATEEAPSNDEPQVSEVAYSDDRSVLELAEMMLAYGRLRGAAETLAAHIEATSPDNILPWSMLLDLYRRGGMREEFETLAALMDQRFNVHLPAWSEASTPVSGLKSLEDYAHIIWRTTHTWGTQSCLDYLYALARDTRAGQRSGFPLEVIEEIALLMRILEDAYGLQRTG